MMDILLDVGTIVNALNEDEEIQKYLIIGKRQYNPNSGKCWDYISVPLPAGYTMHTKCEHPYENNNMYFFNHTDIRSLEDHL